MFTYLKITLCCTTLSLKYWSWLLLVKENFSLFFRPFKGIGEEEHTFIQVNSMLIFS